MIPFLLGSGLCHVFWRVTRAVPLRQTADTKPLFRIGFIIVASESVRVFGDERGTAG